MEQVVSFLDELKDVFVEVSTEKFGPILYELANSEGAERTELVLYHDNVGGVKGHEGTAQKGCVHQDSLEQMRLYAKAIQAGERAPSRVAPAAKPGECLIS